jgi:putative FmdB family regulatory protein
MPLFEYECRTCDRRFEMLVTASRQPVCPSCQGRDLEKLVSVFGVGSSSRAGGVPVSTGST